MKILLIILVGLFVASNCFALDYSKLTQDQKSWVCNKITMRGMKGKVKPETILSKTNEEIASDMAKEKTERLAKIETRIASLQSEKAILEAE